jgi:hypothetical protein
MNMTDKNKIIALIQRRKEHNLDIGNPLFAAMAEEDIEILSEIDSLPVEPKFMVGQVVRSSNGTILKIIGIGQYCYHCDNDYSFGFDIQDEFELVEESASDDLEEEIIKRWKVLHGSGNPIPFDTFNGIARYFTNWQKQKDSQSREIKEVRTSYDCGFYEGYKKGRDKTKHQIMKAAIDAQVVLGPNDNHVLMNGLFNNYKYHDKVKLIIIKEDCV